MKHSVILATFVFSVFHCLSQGQYGIEAGVDKATISKSKVTPALEIYYMKRVTRSVYIGPSLSLQRYSFVYNTGFTPTNVSYGDVLSVSTKVLLFVCNVEV